MTIITPDDMILEKVSGLYELKAREFAKKVKRAGMLQEREVAADLASQAAASAPAPPPGVPAGWYPLSGVNKVGNADVWFCQFN